MMDKVILSCIGCLTFSGVAWCHDILPVQCDADLASIVENDVKVMRESLGLLTSAVLDGDYAAASLVVRWLGAANEDEAKGLMEVYSLISSFSDYAQPLCVPAEHGGGTEDKYVVAQAYHEGVHIYLWGDYFFLEADGRDSRPGTILHELLHLDMFGGLPGPDGEEYDVDAALELARDNPKGAQKNAFNWEMLFNEFVTGETFD